MGNYNGKLFGSFSERNIFIRIPVVLANIKEKSTPFGVDLMVDDTRLELVTSRTSSGCATSCANERFALWRA